MKHVATLLEFISNTTKEIETDTSGTEKPSGENKRPVPRPK